jgi:DNA-binding LytR/AlgR family response regulator
MTTDLTTRPTVAPLRVVVAAPDPSLRAGFVSRLRAVPGVEVVADAGDGPYAVRMIRDVRPDLALLHLDLPQLDGFDVARAASVDTHPLFAFVSAEPRYALQAFELGAVDYLVEPVDPGRLAETIARARALTAMRESSRESSRESPRAHACRRPRPVAAAVRPAERGHGALRRIPVRVGADIVFVPTPQLVSVIAHGDTLHLHTLGGEEYTVVYSLTELEARLDPAEFLRISRSTLVRVDALESLSPAPGGMYVATLRNGQQLTVSRARSRLFREHLLHL